MLHKRWRRLSVILVAGGILFLSLIPKPPPLPAGFRFTDKIAHLLAYAVLSFLVFTAFFEGKPIGTVFTTILIVAAVCLLYGGLIEILQIFTRRHPELWDLTADLIGALCGASLAAGMSRRSRVKSR
jgi:VanZ family protein